MNVSKGEVAKSNDLKKSFGTEDRNTIAREVHVISIIIIVVLVPPPHLLDASLFPQILGKGEVQVGEKEREHDIAALRREIATLVAEKCVDPATQTPYSVSIIEKAMAEAGYSVRANKNAKSQVRPGQTDAHTCMCTHADRFFFFRVQVSECIKILQSDSTLPIERAKMRIRVIVPVADIDGLRETLLQGVDKLEHEETGEEWSGVGKCTTPLRPRLTTLRHLHRRC
jgi:ribosome maturation protein SDO1